MITKLFCPLEFFLKSKFVGLYTRKVQNMVVWEKLHFPILTPYRTLFRDMRNQIILSGVNPDTFPLRCVCSVNMSNTASILPDLALNIYLILEIFKPDVPIQFCMLPNLEEDFDSLSFLIIDRCRCSCRRRLRLRQISTV